MCVHIADSESGDESGDESVAESLSESVREILGEIEGNTDDESQDESYKSEEDNRTNLQLSPWNQTPRLARSRSDTASNRRGSRKGSIRGSRRSSKSEAGSYRSMRARARSLAKPVSILLILSNKKKRWVHHLKLRFLNSLKSYSSNIYNILKLVHFPK